MCVIWLERTSIYYFGGVEYAVNIGSKVVTDVVHEVTAAVFKVASLSVTWESSR